MLKKLFLTQDPDVIIIIFLFCFVWVWSVAVNTTGLNPMYHFVSQQSCHLINNRGSL